MEIVKKLNGYKIQGQKLTDATMSYASGTLPSHLHDTTYKLVKHDTLIKKIDNKTAKTSFIRRASKKEEEGPFVNREAKKIVRTNKNLKEKQVDNSLHRIIWKKVKR
jgi:hypothetical protein